MDEADMTVVAAIRSNRFKCESMLAGGLSSDNYAIAAAYDGALASKWIAVRSDRPPFALASAAILAAPLARSVMNS